MSTQSASTSATTSQRPPNYNERSVIEGSDDHGASGQHETASPSRSGSSATDSAHGLLRTQPKPPDVPAWTRPVDAAPDAPASTQTFATTGPQLVRMPFATLASLSASAAQVADGVQRAAFASGGQAELDRKREACGATFHQLMTFCRDLGGDYAKSASRGRRLASLNDHDGILIVPGRAGRSTIAERLPVIAEQVSGQTLYFILGYGNRIVPFEDFRKALAQRGIGGGAAPDVALGMEGEGPARRKATTTTTTTTTTTSTTTTTPIAASVRAPSRTMETPLRTLLLELSKTSTLTARRNAKESDTKVMHMPLNPTLGDLSSVGRDEWANGVHAMPTGFGPKNDEGFHQFYFDYNKIENRIILFQNDKFDADPPLRYPVDTQTGRRLSINVSGPILAVLDGIADKDGVEVLEPAGWEPGVKMPMGSRRLDAAGPVKLRITTADGAVHELVLDRRGARMALVNPMYSSSGAMALGANAQAIDASVNVYTYCGTDTGMTDSPDGFPDPMLIASNGTRLLCGPLLVDRSGVRGALKRAAGSALELATLPANAQAPRNVTSVAVRTVVKAAVVMGYAYMLGLLTQALRGPDGTLFGQGTAFTGSGAASNTNRTETGRDGPLNDVTSPAVFALNVLTQSVAHLAMDGLLVRIGARLPDSITHTETALRRLIWNWLMPSVQELLHLLLTMSVAKGWGYARGSAGDIGTLGGAAAIHGAVEYMRSHAGGPQNNKLPHVLDLVQVINNFGWRSLGNTLSAPQYQPHKLNRLFTEALATRALQRGPDRALLPFIAALLNAWGIVGPNADVFDHQVDRETRVNNLVAWLRNAAHGLENSATKGLARIEEQGRIAAAFTGLQNFLLQITKCVHECRTRMAQPAHDRSPTYREDIDAANTASSFPRMDEGQQRAYLKALDGAFGDMPLQGANEARFDQLSKKVKSSVHYLHGEGDHAFPGAFEDAGDPDDGNDNDNSVTSPRDTASPIAVQTSYDGRTFEPRHAGAGGMATKELPGYMGTFSPKGQVRALGPHDAMARVPGMSSIRTGATQDASAAWKQSGYTERATVEREYKQLSIPVVDRIELATRLYTLESQFVHYPLRWAHTGQVRTVQVARGVTFKYNVMNTPGNGQQFDPIGPLYMNLGALHAEKFPAIVHRAVVTEAHYFPLEKGQDRPASGPGNVYADDYVGLTEIFSASTARGLVAQFGIGLNPGIYPSTRSQRVVVKQQTAVNIAGLTDLVQAECIMMPGALFRVAEVAPVETADGDSEETGKMEHIGQVLYLEQINTHEMERAYLRMRKDPDAASSSGKPGGASQGARSLIDAETGHFMVEASADSSRQVPDFIPVAKVYNYFLGRHMERADETGNPKKFARWFFPYTSDYSPRATKDAIHAAILQDDPIVPYLDDAIINPHHEEFRRQAKFYETQEGIAWLKKIQDYKASAHAIGTALRNTPLNQPLDEVDVRMFGWLLNSLLRKPVMFVEVGEDGKVNAAGRTELLQETYDKVNTSLDADRSPNEPVLIGVAKDGFYNIGMRNGEQVVTQMAAHDTGRSLGNLLHAYFRASSFSTPQQYRSGQVQELGAVLTPSRGAKSSVQGIRDALNKLLQVDYIVFEKALVAQWKSVGGRDELVRPGVIGESGKPQPLRTGRKPQRRRQPVHDESTESGSRSPGTTASTSNAAPSPRPARGSKTPSDSAVPMDGQPRTGHALELDPDASSGSDPDSRA
jgi:hypothetical protein